MTEETFIELVDLYLDREITKEAILRLKAELAVNADRRQLFLERSRLHKAMQMALNPQMAQNSQMAQTAQTTRTIGASRVTHSGQMPGMPGGLGMPRRGLRWSLGFGLAASLVFGWMFLSSMSLIRPDSQPNAQRFISGTSGTGGINSTSGTSGINDSSAGESISDFVDEALSKWSSEAGLKRYASRQERGLAIERTSLAAQLRLMGLRPELTPLNKELRSIDLATQQAAPTRSRGELLTTLQRHSVMPEPRILSYEVPVKSAVEASDRSYGSGFQPSLISFR